MFMFQFLWTFLLFFLTVFSFEEGRQLSGSVYELIYSENGKSLTIVYNSTPAICWGIADACSQTWQQRIWHFGCMTIILAIQSEKNMRPVYHHLTTTRCERWCECAFLDWFSCFADCCSLHERCQLVSYSPSICETVKNTTQTVATSRHLPCKLQVTKAITKSFLVQHHRYRWLQLATWCHDTLPVWLGKGQMMLHTC